MKVFDATALIAFLSDMKFPDGLEALSLHYKLLVPEGVINEVMKSLGRELLRDLVKNGQITIWVPNAELVSRIEKENPQLHRGECEVIAFAQSFNGDDELYLFSDDMLARKKFQHLNFKWTEELLVHMKAKGIIDSVAYDSKVNELQNSPFYHSARRNH